MAYVFRQIALCNKNLYKISIWYLYKKKIYLYKSLLLIVKYLIKYIIKYIIFKRVSIC